MERILITPLYEHLGASAFPTFELMAITSFLLSLYHVYSLAIVNFIKAIAAFTLLLDVYTYLGMLFLMKTITHMLIHLLVLLIFRERRIFP